MTGNSLNIDTDFHTSSLSTVDTTVCRLCRNYELRTNLVFVDDVLPAKSVTVFFLNCTNNHYFVSFWNESEIFHDLCSVYTRYDTATLVRYSTSTDLCLCLVSIVWIEFPVIDVTDTYCINMCVKCDDLVASSHESHNISLWVDDNFVKSNFLHLSSDCLYVSFLITAFSRIFYDSTKESSHVFLIAFCILFDFVKIHCSSPFEIKSCFGVTVSSYCIARNDYLSFPSQTIDLYLSGSVSPSVEKRSTFEFSSNPRCSLSGLYSSIVMMHASVPNGAAPDSPEVTG